MKARMPILLLALTSSALLTPPPVSAIPPVTIDGVDIPNDFSEYNRLALQTNITSWGKSWGRFYCDGSELDAMWVFCDGVYLYVGITGNLATNGNQIMLFIENTAEPGQNTLLTGLCEGPPFALQDMGAAYREIGDPETPDDDYYTRDGATGAQMDVGFSPNYVIAIDLYEATMHASLYHLYDEPLWDVGPYDHPDTLIIEALDVYTARCYLGQNTVNSGSGWLDAGGSGSPNYHCELYTIYDWEIALDDRNTLGITDTHTTDVMSATRGVEIRAPLYDLGLDFGSTINIMALVTGPGEGMVSNQSLPPMQAGAPNWDGRWPQIDLSDESGTGWDGQQFATIALSTVYTATPPDVDGELLDPIYATTTPVATQIAPTAYGDQTLASEVEIIPGNELDGLFAVYDWANLYVGMTGALATGGEHLVLFLDTLPGTGEATLADNDCWNIFSGNSCVGMNGHTLPRSANNDVVEYDYAVSLHVSGGQRHAVLYDLNNNINHYLGGGPLNTDGLLEGGDNPHGAQLAYNFATLDLMAGVVDCYSDQDPCFLMTPAEVAADAATMTTGFEFALPLPMLGIDPLVYGVYHVQMWGVIVNYDGEWISDQALPSLRGDSVSMMFAVGGEDNVDFTRPDYYHPPFAFDTRAAGYTIGFAPPGADFDHDGDVDLHDSAAFQACFATTGFWVGPGPCFEGDLVPNDTIDAADALALYSDLTGPQ